MARKVQVVHQPKFEDIAHLDHRLNSVRGADGECRLVGRDDTSLSTLITFANELFRSKRSAFTFVTGKRGKEAKRASVLATYFSGLHGLIVEQYASDVSFAPQLRLLFDCYQRHRIRHCRLTHPNHVSVGDELDAEVFEDFIRFIRAEGDWVSITKQVDDWERNMEKNQARLSNYISSLFQRCSKLMVLRIDFLYKSAMVSDEEVPRVDQELWDLAQRDQRSFIDGKTESDVHKSMARVSIQDVMEDREHLFRNMRGKPRIFEHLVGFVWRIEWSRVGGYHLHCAFFFDGNKVHKHEYYADQIGKYWETVITRGRGHHHNCNRKRDHYGDAWALGLIDHRDEEKRGRLMRALSYLTKQDQFVYVKPSVKCKLFGTGRMTSVRTSSPGRPRLRKSPEMVDGLTALRSAGDPAFGKRAA